MSAANAAAVLAALDFPAPCTAPTRRRFQEAIEPCGLPATHSQICTSCSRGALLCDGHAAIAIEALRVHGDVTFECESCKTRLPAHRLISIALLPKDGTR